MTAAKIENNFESTNHIRFSIISLRLTKDSTTPRQLFIKEHSLRRQEANKPQGRTLFILNIPPYIDEDNVKTWFCSAGKILNVFLENQQITSTNGYKQAYVVFVKREGLLKALQMSHVEFDGDRSVKTGLEKYIENYNNSICDPDKLSKELSTFMLKFEKNEKKDKKTKDVDEDGWTVVTRKGHKPGLANKESVKLKLNEKIGKKSKVKELKNFYTFQLKERKMKNLTELRKNFEEAKKKINLMKSSRRFKPY
ncbi:hypothetical protein ABEB36_006979 [Hypothenemus hampei]|uniref:RRM domain-containing protein n=1 Tax=Hypothenemus hampei TaxID=57062 RepID=A0ABD1ESC6_HYPHA